MSILQTVRTATASKHEIMEKLIGSDRLSNFSIEDYKLLLSTNYLFHSHLEHKIDLFLSIQSNKNSDYKLDFENRLKTIYLEEELKKLIPLSVFQELKSQENTISFSSFDALLGWLYVAEGSMLGGKMIHKILSQNEEVNHLTDFDFYQNYQEKTSSLWKTLKELIEQKCITEKEKEQFLDGAEKSYLYFESCFYEAKNTLQNN